MSSSTRPPVRVVCVTYNPGPELEDQAKSLADATASPVHLALVDNGSADDRPERVAAAHGGEVIRAGENLGYGSVAPAAPRFAARP